ncbi:MAG: hypothetical protein ACREV0_13045 [Burkholderiales bacterium]
MARVVRFHQIGGPEVLNIEEVEVGEPGPQEIRVQVEAIGLNRASFNPGSVPADIEPAATNSSRTIRARAVSRLRITPSP